MKHHGFLAIPAALLLFACGCDDISGKVAPEDSRAMREAREAENLGNFGEALMHYDDVIAQYPKYAIPHLQMAIILHEKKKDYIGAIYHYGRYTHLAEPGRDRSNIDIVSNRMAKVRQLLNAQCAKAIASGSANDNVRIMGTIADLNHKVTALENEKKVLASSNEVLRTEIVSLNNRITRQTLLLNRMKNTSEGGPAPKGSLAGIVQYQTLTNEDGSTTSVQTYEVRSGDTLSKIAEIAYGDASKWPRIRKANPDKIKDDRVRPGDVLIIPDE